MKLRYLGTYIGRVDGVATDKLGLDGLPHAIEPGDEVDVNDAMVEGLLRSPLWESAEPKKASKTEEPA